MKKIIAVDGPAGAGKSTVSKICAARLGYTYIDTGAMYRAVALKVLSSGKPVDDELIISVTNDIKIELDEAARVFLDGREVTKEIRTPEVSRGASDVAKVGFVRKKLTELQRQMAVRGSVIMDGRDIGTQVLPNADLKIFLTASVAERARRRFEELKAKGVAADLSQIEREIISRDKQDSEREIAPLAQAEDAVLVDSTFMTIEEVVDKILQLAKNSEGSLIDMAEIKNPSVFDAGKPLPEQFSKYFIGQAYLNPLTKTGGPIANVTFSPGCRNNWHIHHKGGQILLVTGGRGWYQEWGKAPQSLKPGDVVNIAPEVKHWHGAAADSWFSHLAVEIPAEGSSNEWLEPVDDEQYAALE